MKETIFFFVFSFCLHSQQLQSQFRPLSFEEKHKDCLPNSLNVSYVDECKAEISKHIDNLESQKPKPKNQIRYWQSVLKNLEKNKTSKSISNNNNKNGSNRTESKVAKPKADNVNVYRCSDVYINPKLRETSKFRPFTSVRFENMSGVTVYIHSARYGIMVNNFCDGGSLTLNFLPDPFFTNRNGTNIDILVSSEKGLINTFNVFIPGNYGYYGSNNIYSSFVIR